MATAKSYAAISSRVSLLVVALLATSITPFYQAHGAVTTGAQVICDASVASNLSLSACTNTGAGGGTISLVGSPTRSTRGQGSIGFNLTSLSQNQYGNGTLGSTSSVDSITVEMFLYLSSNGNLYNSSGSMLFQFANGTASYNIYHYQHFLGFNTFNSEVYGIDATSYEDSWHHYVFVASKSSIDASQAIYIDGVKQNLSFVFGSSSTSSAKVFDALGNFRLMNHGYSANTWNAKGELGLLRIYKRGLTAAEITNNFQAEAWRMNTTTSFSSLTLSNSPKKGLTTTITATVSNPGKVRFFQSGKRIPGCVSVATTGSGPITATCYWRPTTSGGVIISASLTPTDSSLTSSTSHAVAVSSGRRVSIR